MPPNASSLLQLLWLASPALPVGGYSYSEGLESAIEAGAVTNESSASDWLLDQLHLALGRSELPLLAQAFTAWTAHDAARVAELNDWAWATRETSELRRQAADPQGGSRLEQLVREGVPEAVHRERFVHHEINAAQRLVRGAEAFSKSSQ